MSPSSAVRSAAKYRARTSPAATKSPRPPQLNRATPTWERSWSVISRACLPFPLGKACTSTS
jgi:hypothetical protein